MSNVEKKLVNWSDMLNQIMDNIDYGKGLLSTKDQMSAMNRSLMPNLIPYHEYSSTVRPEIRRRIVKYIDAELSKYEQIKKKKSSEEADRLRAEGNAQYEQKNFDSALHAYTMSILYAPPERTEEKESTKKSSSLALAYGNRSAAFFEIGQWASALADIEHALEAGHQGVEKLLLRKADALISLSKFGVAKAVLNDSCLKKNSSLKTTIAGRLATVEGYLKRAKTSPFKEITIPPTDLPPLSEIVSTLSSSSEQRYEPSAEIPSLSRKLEVQWSLEKRRHLVAKEPIAPGDILAVELPYACTLIKKEELSYCHHCCRRLKTDQFEVRPNEEVNFGSKRDNAERCQGKSMYTKAAVPCPKCTNLLYCSDSCREAAWRAYHQYECSILPMLYNLGLGHLALRMLFVLNSGGDGISKAKKVVQRADQADGGLPLNQTSEPPYSAVYQLVHNSFFSNESMHLQISYGVTSGLLLELAIRVGFLDRATISPDDLHLTGGLLQRHLMLLSVNAHAIDDYKHTVSEDRVLFRYRDVPIASGVYPWISLINHACEPNVVPTFDCGRLILLRASVPIAVGEEVVNSYCVHFAKMDVAERQKRLNERYNFECKCPKCDLELKNGLNGWYVPLKCQNCPGLIARKDNDIFHCTACGKTVSLEEMKLRYDSFKKAFLQAQNCLLSKESFYKDEDDYFAVTERAIEQAQAMLATGKQDNGKVAYGASRVQLELGRIIDTLSGLYLFNGRSADATRMAERSADIVEAAYGSRSIVLAHELGKVVDTMAQLIRDEIIVSLREEERQVTKEESALINRWKKLYERMMTLLGHYSLSGIPPPLGDIDSCYFASERRRKQKWMGEFDTLMKMIEETRKQQSKETANKCTSKLQQMLLDED